MLAILYSGKTYIPLNPALPREKQHLILEKLSAKIIIIDNESIIKLQKVLDNNCQLTLIFPEHNNHTELNLLFNSHIIMTANDINCSAHELDHEVNRIQPLTNTINKNAYILFTSGTTGIPKAVEIQHTQINHYLQTFITHAKPTPDDHFIQLADLSFDFSVHDCFSAWSVGAALYVYPQQPLLGLPDFIIKHSITVWGSVPSVITLLQQWRVLKPQQFPSIRYSMFCGEILTERLAKSWSRVAPHSMIDNFYGPTEAAVCCSVYRWNKDSSRDDDAIVPIGMPFPNHDIMIVANDLTPVTTGEIGELLITGAQVIAGYWQDAENTAYSFVRKLNSLGKMQTWYRTGDMVKWDKQEGLIFCGRKDDQIKIRGIRVQKAEIELLLRKIAGTDAVAVVPWSIDENGMIMQIAAYIAGNQIARDEILSLCKKSFPDYMIPREIYILDKLPYLTNGKVDYQKLKSTASKQDDLL